MSDSVSLTIRLTCRCDDQTLGSGISVLCDLSLLFAAGESFGEESECRLMRRGFKEMSV